MKGRTPRAPVAAMAAAALLAADGAAAQTADARLHADVTVTHMLIEGPGGRVRELPASRYHLEREAGGRLRLTMLATTPNPARGPLADRYAGITVETGDDGWPRMRDAAGRSLATPPPGEASGDTAATGEGLIAHRRDRGERLEALRRRFGVAAGTVGTLTRYVAGRDGVVEEALVAADSGLPVELNRLERGVLVEHHRFDYTAVGEWLVRTRTRSEATLGDDRGTRLVSVTTLSAVQVEGGTR